MVLTVFEEGWGDHSSYVDVVKFWSGRTDLVSIKVENSGSGHKSSMQCSVCSVCQLTQVDCLASYVEDIHENLSVIE